MALDMVNYVDRFFMLMPKTIPPGTRFMGRDIPKHVTHTDMRHSMTDDAIQVRWRTATGTFHELELQRPLTEESITTLLVSMRLSC